MYLRTLRLSINQSKRKSSLRKACCVGFFVWSLCCDLELLLKLLFEKRVSRGETANEQKSDETERETYADKATISRDVPVNFTPLHRFFEHVYLLR